MATPTFASVRKNVLRNIHILRVENKFSTREFAQATNLSETTIRRAEKAYRNRRPYNPQLSTLVKLSQATGLTLDDMTSSYLARAK